MTSDQMPLFPDDQFPQMTVPVPSNIPTYAEHVYQAGLEKLREFMAQRGNEPHVLEFIDGILAAGKRGPKVG